MKAQMIPFLGDTWLDKWFDKLVAGGGAILLAWFGIRGQRNNARALERQKREDARESDREKKESEQRNLGEAGRASVELAHLTGLEKEAQRRSEEVAALRAEMQRNHAENRATVSLLENKINVLTASNYQLFSAITLLQQSWRTMKARLKRADKDFDEKEFPDIDKLLEELHPSKVFAALNQPTHVSVFSSPSDPDKTTTVIKQGGSGN